MLHEIMLDSKEEKLKIDIEINKLKKAILKQDQILISVQFNVIADMMSLYQEKSKADKTTLIANYESLE